MHARHLGTIEGTMYRSLLTEGDPWVSIAYSRVCEQQGVYYTAVGQALQASTVLQEGVVLHLGPACVKVHSIVDEEGLQVLQRHRVGQIGLS